jgi:2-aminophenol/2-amino-5-chlorophenol 1,6-dioxygenase alpha subunit
MPTTIAAALVPGLPHILKPDMNAGYRALAGAVADFGDRLAERGVKRVVYYSTQWISVLGHSFQARQKLEGLHVDENWYDLMDLPFDFRVDLGAAKAMADAAGKAGYQARLIDYDGFPVDTGTIVADKLLNKGRFSTGMVSCCVYSDYADTTKLASTLTTALAKDGVPTAVVCVSSLSGRWFTTEVDLREDHVSSPEDDKWNKRIIGLLEKGELSQAEALLPEYAGACKVDMGLKALAFLKGAGAAIPGKGAVCHAYGGIYGTGAAVLEF